MPATIMPRLTLQHFREMEALELQFYAAEFITPAEESWSWYDLHPHSTVAAKVKGKLAGFVKSGGGEGVHAFSAAPLWGVEVQLERASPVGKVAHQCRWYIE